MKTRSDRSTAQRRRRAAVQRSLRFEACERRDLLAALLLSASVPADPGDSVTVLLAKDDFANGQAIDATIAYPTAQLDVAPADIVPTGLASGWTLTANVDETAGRIFVSLFGVQPLPAQSGDLVAITFDVASTATGTLPLDLAGLVNEAPVTAVDGSIVVAAANTAPTANDDRATVTEGSIGNLLAVLANDSSLPDVGETLTVTAVGAPNQGGSVVVAPGGAGVLYSPAANFVGQESFSYTISDGRGGTDTALVEVTVAPLRPVLNVRTGATYRTIAEGIGAAAAGDTLELADGVYRERIAVDRPLTIRAVHVGGAILDAGDPNAESVVHAFANATLIGLHLRNASNGLFMRNSAIHVRVENGIFSDIRGSAVTISNSAGREGSIDVVNATIVNCSDAVNINDGGTITVTNAVIDSAVNAFVLHNGNAIVARNVLLHDVTRVTAGTDVAAISIDPVPLSADPRFVDRAAGNFRLQSGSPAIDAGRNAGLSFLGSAPDLGAFEFNPVGHLSGMVWLDPNRDGVRQATERGKADVLVELLDDRGAQVRTAHTDAAGQYAFLDLVPGDYRVRFLDPLGTNFAPRDRGTNDAVDSDADPLDGRTGIVAVASGATTEHVDAGLTSALLSVELRTLAATDGRTLTAVPLGESFVLEAVLTDHRPLPTGVFQARFDATYDALVAVDGPLAFAAQFPHARGGDVSGAGVIDEARAYAGTTALGAGPQPFFRLPMTAEAVGTARFGTDASESAAFGFYFFDSLTEVPRDEIDFRGARLEIVDGAAPVAANDAFSTNEDGVLSVPVAGVLANDRDADGDPLTATLVAGPTHGQLTFTPDGSFVYRPNADFHGSDRFTYRASDGQLTSELATVTVTVSPVNDIPAATADAYTARRNRVLTIDAPHGLLANDRDIDGDTLTVTLVESPAHGVVQLLSDGSFRYQPERDYLGADRFTYRVADGNGGEATAAVALDVVLPTVLFSVAAVDANGQTIRQVAEGDAFELRVFVQDLRPEPLGVHAGYLDVNYDFTRIEPTGAITFGPDYPNGSSGDLTLDGLFDEAGVFDGFGPLDGASRLLMKVPMRATALGTARVTSDPADWSPAHDVLVFGLDEPVPVEQIEYGELALEVVVPSLATDDVFTTSEDSFDVTLDVLANDVLNTSAPARIVAVGALDRGGRVEIAADGQSLVYTPAPNFHGVETFQYRLRDGLGNERTAMVAVTVTPVNDPPTANDDRFVRYHGDALDLPVLANDTAAPDRGDTLRIVAVSTPDQGGQVTIAADGQSVIYTPNGRFVGSERFTYTIRDNDGATATATVIVEMGYRNWQNPRNRFDVNDDGFVTPIDALLVINQINRLGSQPLPAPAAPDRLPPPFVDVSGDDFRTPIDVLLVIDFLMRQQG